MCVFAHVAMLSLSSVLVLGQTTARLETADTILQVEAGPAAPRVVAISSPPQMPWANTSAEQLIASVSIGSAQVAVHWQVDPTANSRDSHQVTFVYKSESPRLRLSWKWQVRAAFGPIEHEITIENLDHREIWLSLQPSFQFSWKIHSGAKLEQLYVEKGANTPSEIGTHFVPIVAGYKWRGSSSTYAHPNEVQPREIIPWFLVEETSSEKSGWFVGIEFSGRTELRLERDGQLLKGVVGLNPDPAPFRTRLEAGESFDTPRMFLGAFQGGSDAAGNVMRRWVRNVLGNPQAWSDPNYPLLVNNSWGNGMKVNEEIARTMIRDAADLGIEMFHQDAGWFRGVGDWYPNPQKFPHGMAGIADDAHKHGMKFGLWVDWTQAAFDTDPGALNAADPTVRDWMVTDLPPDWKAEDFKGQTIDLGVPQARDWAQREVDRIVTDYHLDMLEHDGYLVAQGCDRSDHPHAPPDNWNKCIYKAWGSYWVESSNSTDVSYHAVLAYYDIYTQLRKNHPGILLEVCNDGGRMIDFGSAAHADYFSMTDTYDPLSNRRAFYDESHVLPSAMLESYLGKWPVPHRENFLYMLRSGMMGWLTVMMDTTSWSSDQHRIAKKEFALYKGQLRPLIRDADLYHVSPRPDGVHWDGIEYFDPNTRRGVVYVFHGSAKEESTHSFVLKGLDRSANYQLRFHDHTSPDRSISGRELMTGGLKVALAAPYSSELVLIEERRSAGIGRVTPISQ
jgi:hypothetical protein